MLTISAGVPERQTLDDNESTSRFKRESSPASSITPSERALLTALSPSQSSPARDANLMTAPAPRNTDGLLPCPIIGCKVTPFQRNCEWRKHMDTHDKPWLCEHPDCGGRDGFTWKGGLTRHRREVHGVDLEGREEYLCPRVDCRRSRGHGFKRKENLMEHLRSVHGLLKEHSGVTMAGESPSRVTSESSLVFRSMSTASQTRSDVESMSPGSHKRKISSDVDRDAAYKLVETDLSRENKRLRRELEIVREGVVMLERDAREQLSRHARLQQAFLALSNAVATR